jgi:polysaccharide biosynthesis protein VpsM
MKTKKTYVVSAIVLSCSAPWASAQVAYVRPAYTFPLVAEGSGPAAVRMGSTPFYFSPYVGAAVGRDDNLFLSSSNEKRSTLYIVSPGFKIDARDSNKVFQLGYQAQAGRYSSSEDDNYVDHTLRSQLDVAFDRRNFLKLGYDYSRAHDPRGSTDRPIAGRPDRYWLSSPNATYAFGAPGAAGRLEVYGSAGRKRYLNNRGTTINGDRDTTEFGGVFYWRAMPRTYLLAEARRTDLDYKASQSTFDSRETRYFGGVMWEATAATTGTLKVGRLEKRFDTVHPEFSGTSWEAHVGWAPRSYSKFDFFAARSTTEATGLGSFILTDVAGVSWTHAWSSVLSTAVDARYQKDEYQGFAREDDIKSLGFKVGYKFRRWLTLGAEYNHVRRDSSQRIFEYDKNLYLLTATASM